MSFDAGLGGCFAATAFLYTTAIAEERENHQRFGEEYEAYVAKTKRFIPFVF